MKDLPEGRSPGEGRLTGSPLGCGLIANKKLPGVLRDPTLNIGIAGRRGDRGLGY